MPNYWETRACIAYTYRNKFIKEQEFALYAMLTSQQIQSFRTGTTKDLI